MRIEPKDLKDLGLLKHYRIIRKWACRNNNLTDPDLELLIYLDCMEFFTKQDFKTGTYAYSWNNRRWNDLLKNGWIVVWRERDYVTRKYNIYKVSFKCKQLISKMYRIMLGKENIPTSHRNSIMNNDTYMNTVSSKAITNANNDKK